MKYLLTPEEREIARTALLQVRSIELALRLRLSTTRSSKKALVAKLKAAQAFTSAADQALEILMVLQAP